MTIKEITMKMKWIRAIKVNPYEYEFTHTIIDVKKVLWNDVKMGDKVFIPGNIENNKPTAIYGPHIVVKSNLQQLQNRSERKFYERSSYLFMEVENGN